MKELMLGGLLLFGTPNLYAGDFWRQLNGPAHNAVWSVAIAPVTGDIFVSFPARVQPDGGIQASLVFRSTDHGDSWTALTNGLDGVRAVGLLAAGGSTVFASAQTGGVYRSLDNGNTWQPVTNGLPNQTFAPLGAGFVGDVFAGTTSAGVFRSTNNGTNWFASNNGLTNLHVNVIRAGTGGMLFLGTDGGVFRSADNGTNWTPANTGLTNLTVTALALTPTGDLFAGTAGGVFTSSDNGNNWTPASSGLPDPNVRSLLMDAAGTLFVGTSTGLFVRTNGGSLWVTPDFGCANIHVGRLEQDTSGRLFAGTAVGLFRSTNNGATWQPLETGLVTGIIKSLTTTATEIFAGTLNTGLHRSRDAGQTWERMPLANAPDTANVFSLSVSPANCVFVGLYVLGTTDLASHLFRSDNGGDTWQPANSGTLTAHVVGGFVFAGADEIFATTAFTAKSGVIRSLDNGTNWSATGLQNVVTYSVSRNASGHLFAGTECCGVYRSLDNGTNWTSVGPVAGNILDLAINSQGHVFAASSTGSARGLYRSLDNGTNWVNVLPNIRCGAVVVTQNDTVYVGATEGVFCSTNNGTNFTTVNSGLLNASVISLTVGVDGRLYAGSGGAGVFRSVLPVNPVSSLTIAGSNGAVAVQLHGMPLQTYSLLTSTNLNDWIPFGPVVTGAEGDAPPVNVTANTTNRYYRAVWP